jgi:hypothetical protein
VIFFVIYSCSVGLKCIWAGMDLYGLKFNLVTNYHIIYHVRDMWLPRQRHVDATSATHGYRISAASVPCGSHVSDTWPPCQHHMSNTSAPRGRHVSTSSSTACSPRQHLIICQQPPHLYKWRVDLIHDDHLRHRFWALGWVQWALHQSMTT